MKKIKDSWEDSWDDMTKYHRAKAPEFAFDVLEWLRRLKAEKLKGVMDRSRLYWAKKKAQKEKDLQRQKVELMWAHLRKHKELLGEIREEAVERAKRKAKENAHV